MAISIDRGGLFAMAILKKGSKGKQVEKLQDDLNKLGAMIWSLFDFGGLWRRRIKTKVNCLVEVVFD